MTAVTGRCSVHPAAAERSVRPCRLHMSLHPRLLPSVPTCLSPSHLPPLQDSGHRGHGRLTVSFCPRPPPQVTVQPGACPRPPNQCPPGAASVSLATSACPKMHLPLALPTPVPLWSPVPPVTAPFLLVARAQTLEMVPSPLLPTRHPAPRGGCGSPFDRVTFHWPHSHCKEGPGVVTRGPLRGQITQLPLRAGARQRGQAGGAWLRLPWDPPKGLTPDLKGQHAGGRASSPQVLLQGQDQALEPAASVTPGASGSGRKIWAVFLFVYDFPTLFTN